MKAFGDFFLRFLRTRGIAICFLFLVATVAMYFLAVEWDESSTSNNGVHLANLSDLKGTVKVKSAGSFVWKTLAKNSPLFLNETIMTGEDSFAAIAMNDGSTFQVESNTYLLLDRVNAENLSLLQGAMVVRGEGSTADERISRSEGTNLDVRDLIVRLIEPKPLSLYFTAPQSTRAIRMAWSDLNNVSEKIKVQVSSKQNFPPEDLIEVVPQDKQAQVLNKFPKGIYYWRIINSAQIPISETSQFTVVEASGLQPLEPIGTATLWSDSLKFRWAAPPKELASAFKSDTHQLEIALDTEFKKSVSKKGIRAADSQIAIKGLKEGTYFWRIVSQFDDIQVLSEVQTIDVSRARYLSISPSLPAADAFLREKDNVNLAWKSNASEAEFNIELLNSTTKETKSFKRQALSLVIPNLNVGSYQWRVSTRYGSFQGATKWNKFYILKNSQSSLIYPRMAQHIIETENSRAFELAWSAIPGTSEYRVELSHQKDFREIIGVKETSQTKTSSSNLIVNTFDQYYFWRVIALNADQPIALSPTGEFRHSSNLQVHAPELKFPADQGVLNPVVDKKPPQFSWAPAKGARSYEISFFQMDAEKKISSAPIIRTTTKTLTYTTTALPEGLYSWVVKSVDADGKLGASSSSRSFRISFGAPLRAPSATSVKVQ